MSLKGVPDSAPSAANPACKHNGSKFLRIKLYQENNKYDHWKLFKESNSAQTVIVFLLN